MATIPLTAGQVQQLHAANAAITRGEPATAIGSTSALLAAGARHPDVLAIHGIACRKLGRLDDARAAFESALVLAPRNAMLWNSYANLLADLDALDAALAAYRRSLDLAPANLSAWINSGIVASRAGQHDHARHALKHATALAPQSAEAWAALGSAENAAQQPDQALEPLAMALALNPEHGPARHNRAVALRALDRPDEALAEVDRAIAAGFVTPDTLANQAHLLAELGRFDAAVAAYRRTLHTYPGHLDAHETLARLLPQLGRVDEALDGYREALARMPQSAELWQSALVAARDLKRPDILLEWAHAAQAATGGSPLVTIMAAIATGMSGDPVGALALLDPLVGDSNPAALGHAAYWQLARGDPAAAALLAERAAALNPLAQAPWAYLTIIWRLLDDPREHWLADYERLVMPVDLGMTPAMLAALDDALTAMHTAIAHPADQSLRYGTQTRGNLFDRRHPAIVALKAEIAQRVAERLQALPDDDRHPFLSRRRMSIRFAGSWSVRLASQGFHVNHIHQNGWLSSALHVALPPELGETASPADLPPGALTFGLPDSGLGLALAPRRIERPVPGRLIVFPSYFWHGTVPFISDHPRLTVAFDAVPA